MFKTRGLHSSGGYSRKSSVGQCRRSFVRIPAGVRLTFIFSGIVPLYQNCRQLTPEGVLKNTKICPQLITTKSVRKSRNRNSQKVQKVNSNMRSLLAHMLYVVTAREAKIQGWEFAHLISERIACFLSKNEQMSTSLKKMSYSLIRSFLMSNLSDSLTITHFLCAT